MASEGKIRNRGKEMREKKRKNIGSVRQMWKRGGKERGYEKRGKS